MSAIFIKKVENNLDRRRLMTFPWKVYKDDPLWVPPLLLERKNVIHPEKGVFFKRGQADFYLAYKSRKLAGTICVGEDPPTNLNGKRKKVYLDFWNTSRIMKMVMAY